MFRRDRRPTAVALLVVTLAAYSLVWAEELIQRGTYEVTVQTSMPNLEENLRYTTTRETRCFAQQDLPQAFPILDHPALAGCELALREREQGTLVYALVCESGQDTTGEAVWRLAPSQLRGTLRVRLGGKNTTVHQRVTARLVNSSCR